MQGPRALRLVVADMLLALTPRTLAPSLRVWQPQCFGVGKGIALMLEGGEAGEADVHPFLRSQADPARFA